MQDFLGASLVVVAFATLVHFVGLTRWTTEVVARARESIAVLKDPQLNDKAKGKAMQRNAVVLFKLLGLLLLGSAIAILTPVALLWLAERAGLLSLDGSLEILQRWDFLLVATLVGFAVYFGLRRLRT